MLPHRRGGSENVVAKQDEVVRFRPGTAIALRGANPAFIVAECCEPVLHPKHGPALFPSHSGPLRAAKVEDERRIFPLLQG